jgi:short-subunit dehydrogenase
MHLILGANSEIARSLMKRLGKEAIFATYNKTYPTGLPTKLEFSAIEQVDMSDPDSILSLTNHPELNNITKISWLVGKINIMKFARYDFNLIHKEYMINVLGLAMLLNRLFYNNQIMAGASICLVSSGAALGPGKGQSIYASSKAALNSLAVNISLEYHQKRIKCYAICPGFFKSPSSELYSSFLSKKYIGKITTPKDVANKINELHANPESPQVVHEI